MNIYDVSEMFEKIRKKRVRHSLIQIYDNTMLSVEECKEVLLFDENTIKLILAKSVITITGLDLKMKNFSDRGVVITGALHSIGFDDNERNR
ncbi:MAG: YabP/YqfC family sporulation protein [Ruminiclostridium sp.]|nr:YabP/YqfC family sporulation protein [Ruminiclostridium sp.]